MAHEIATALANATEIEKAEFAAFLTAELARLDLADADAAKRQVVAAFDRYARPVDEAQEDAEAKAIARDGREFG
ncbi:hypothetical protein GI374_09060 [Paracoccus sp. S-4012]|uniref:hypothetical protein n=1 Tax=Paracoccus sp. S-4012 TaxID=2665648 RepID=UPI0012AEFF1A|nr:hypothetical protein [Paracoccus sp. S-4012]MRX50591.1 hypothetical protein [Paracoccus sp. S-4012]